jgi:hypothetical protein
MERPCVLSLSVSLIVLELFLLSPLLNFSGQRRQPIVSKLASIFSRASTMLCASSRQLSRQSLSRLGATFGATVQPIQSSQRSPRPRPSPTTASCNKISINTTIHPPKNDYHYSTLSIAAATAATVTLSFGCNVHVTSCDDGRNDHQTMAYESITQLRTGIPPPNRISNISDQINAVANSVSPSDASPAPKVSGSSSPPSSSHDGSSRSSYFPRAEEDKSSVAPSTSCIPSPTYETSRTQPSSLPAEASIVTFSPINSSSNNRKRKTVSEETTSEQQHDPKRRRV